MLGVVERRSGYNLFLQANMRAFNGEGCCMISCISVPGICFTE